MPNRFNTPGFTIQLMTLFLTGLIIQMLLLILCFTVYVNLEGLLLLIGQDPEVARWVPIRMFSRPTYVETAVSSQKLMINEQYTLLKQLAMRHAIW